jgi:hypothetical protein
MPRNPDEKRQWTRLPISPRRDVIIRSPEHTEFTGRLLNESFGGAAIVLDDNEIPPEMLVGELVQIQDQGVWNSAFVRHIRTESAVGIIVGVEWLQWSNNSPSQPIDRR